MGIYITDKSIFLGLLKKNKSNHDVIYDTLKKYIGIEKDLPSKYSRTTLKNYNPVSINIVTGILFLFLEDHKREGRFYFNYTTEDLQKVFVHFKIQDLLKHENLRPKYNTLIKKLTVDNEEFKDIYLNENWQIAGGNTVDIKKYKDRFSQDHTDLKKQRIPLYHWIYGVIILSLICFLLFKNLRFWEQDISSESFESYSDDNGILTISNYSLKKFKESNEFSNNTLGNIGDTILMSLRINNKSKDTIFNTKIKNINGAFFNGYSMSIIGSITQDSIPDNVDIAYLQTINQARITSLYGCSYITRHENDTIVKIDSLSQTEEFYLFNNGLIIEEIPPDVNTYQTVHSMIVIEKPLVTKKGFDPDPSKKGLGFFTINEAYIEKGSGQKNTITIPNLEKGEVFDFTLYLDFRNQGKSKINNAKAIILEKDLIREEKYIFTAELFADGTQSIYDSVTLLGLKPEYGTSFIAAHIENSHYESDTQICNGSPYGYKNDITQEQIFMDGVSLETLDNYKNGWCDQGTIAVKLQFENIEK